MDRMTPRDVLMALAVSAVWGMGLVVAKGAIAEVPPILLMALRFALTAAALVWFVPVPRHALGALFRIAIIAAALQYSLTFTGLKGLEAGIAALIVQLEVPFLVLFGALLLGERPGARKWLGIAIAFCGVAIMGARASHGAELASVALVVAGGMCWALGQVMVRRLEGVGALQVTAWVAVFATPQLFAMSAVFETGQAEALARADARVWLAVVYLGLVMTALGYALWNALIRRHEVGRVAPWLLLLPFFTMAGGALFLGERPSPEKLAGGLVILLGVAVITLRPRRRAAAAPPPGLSPG